MILPVNGIIEVVAKASESQSLVRHDLLRGPRESEDGIRHRHPESECDYAAPVRSHGALYFRATGHYIVLQLDNACAVAPGIFAQKRHAVEVTTTGDESPNNV